MRDGCPLLMGDNSHCVSHVVHNAHENVAHVNVEFSIDLSSVNVHIFFSICGHVAHANSPSSAMSVNSNGVDSNGSL